MTIRKNGRATVLAHVGVGLPSHPRMLRIPKGAMRGEALGCWLAATCYSRDGELDGWCPAEALEAISTPETRARLVEVGLFAASKRDGVEGYLVLRYEEFNETKEEIDARLAADRRRKPVRVRSDSDRIPTGTPPHIPDIDGIGIGTGKGSLGVQGVPPSADVAEPRTSPVTAATPAAGRGLFAFDRTEWASGVAEALGKPFASPTGFDAAPLEDAAVTHAGGAAGHELAAWYRTTAKEFVIATLEDRRHWPLSPKSWRRWLDAKSPTAAQLARDGPKNRTGADLRQKTPADAPWLRGLS